MSSSAELLTFPTLRAEMSLAFAPTGDASLARGCTLGAARCARGGMLFVAGRLLGYGAPRFIFARMALNRGSCCRPRYAALSTRRYGIRASRAS